MRKVGALCCLGVSFASLSAFGQRAPSPFVDESVFIRTKLVQLDDELRALAIPRLNLAYPVVSSGARGAMQEFQRAARRNRGLSNVRVNGGEAYVDVDWSTATFSLLTPDPTVYSHRVDLGEPTFEGYESTPKPAANYVTYWNCTSGNINVKLSNKDIDTRSISTSDSQAHTKETYTKIIIKYEGQIKKAEAELSKKLTEHFQKTTTESSTSQADRGADYDLDVPGLSARQVGGAVDSRVQRWSAPGIFVVDVPLYAALGGTSVNNRDRRFFVGNWSDFTGEEHRSIALKSTVLVPTVNRNLAVANPIKFQTESECKAAMAKAMNVGDDPFTRSSAGNPPSGLVKTIVRSETQLMHQPSAFKVLASNPAQVPQKGSCTARAEGRANLSGSDRVDLSFNVTVQSCPLKDFDSSGEIQYKLRIKDSKGIAAILPGVAARWQSRSGASFSADGQFSVRAGAVSRVEEVIDERVTDCTCFAR